MLKINFQLPLWQLYRINFPYHFFMAVFYFDVLERLIHHNNSMHSFEN